MSPRVASSRGEGWGSSSGFLGVEELGWELARNGKISTYPQGDARFHTFPPYASSIHLPPTLPSGQPGPLHSCIRWGEEVRGHLDRPLRLEALGTGKRPELLVSEAPCPHLKAGQVCISDTKQSMAKVSQQTVHTHLVGGHFAVVIFVLIFIQHLKYRSQR